MNTQHSRFQFAAILVLTFLCFFDLGHAEESKISERDKASYARDGGHYVPAPELSSRPGIPKGAVTKYHLENSKVYPGVAHDYWIYVPAQYQAATPASLMVILDGEGYLSGEVSIPVLLDNLIHDKQIPVMIGLFVNAGPIGPGYPIYGGSGNRAVEYDSVDGRYAEFLVEELLPRIKAKYSISDGPSHHGIMGGSSGGSAAFGVAWHRPDEFSRVISIVGSFVNIRGADAYPWMIRRAERKPIRIYLQDGSNDLDTVFGDWPLGNRQVAAALAYRDYDYRFEFGEGGHNVHHFASLAADAMRWLWRND